jgi:PAT family beta-lactamase induction signal transducer AmpG
MLNDQDSPMKRFNHGFLELVSVYWERRLIIIFFMGFASGLPLALTSTVLQWWLSDVGVSLTAIGLFALVGTPYSLKFFWAPFIDSVPIPIFSNMLGRRRAWMIMIQMALMGSIIGLGLTKPEVTPMLTAIFAFAVAFFSASQDIVIDAYRIDILDEDEQGAGAAMTQAGYRVGAIASGAALILFDWSFSWSLIYGIMGGLVIVGFFTALRAPIPRTDHIDKAAAGSAGMWIQRNIVSPYIEFFQRNRISTALVILAFIVLFKFGDAFLSVMAYPFYYQIGFTGSQVWMASATFGKIAIVVGAFAGGLVVKRYGILKSLLIGGLLQMLSNLMYAAQAAIGPEYPFLFLTIAIENISQGMGSSAFIAYLSMLCNTLYTGTQYALFASLMNIARTWLVTPSGWAAEKLGWISFFILTTFLAVPGLLMLLWMMKQLPMSVQKGRDRT